MLYGKHVERFLCNICCKRKKSKLVPLSATGKPTPPTNAVTETISTVTGDVIRPISAIFVIALNFFANCFENLVL